MSEHDRHLSPCRRLGYTVGDLFQVTDGVYHQSIDKGGNLFIEPAEDLPAPGSLVRLDTDDKTATPFFKVVMGC